MPFFKVPDGSLHFLSEEDIANGGMLLLPGGYVAATDAEAASIQQSTKRDVPLSVTRLQAKAALLQAGLLDAANAHFAQVDADPLARLAWADATTFERDSRLVAATAAALNLSGAQVDDLFRSAATIEV